MVTHLDEPRGITRRRGPGHAAPYGQACLHCFKSKSKCVSHGNGTSCERCHRLNKECCPSDSFRRRNAKKSQDSSVKIAQLEGRIDNLVSLLQSVTEHSGSSASLREALENRPQVLNPQERLGVDEPGSMPTSSFRSTATPTGHPKQAHHGASFFPQPSPSCDTSDTGPLWEITSSEAEAHITTFRTQMLRFFAFLDLPLETSAQELRQEKPLLFRAIMTVTAPSIQLKLLRGRGLKHLIAQAALIETQASIDLLLTLLTYVAWGYDQFLNKVASSSRLTQLAMSLVYDLRLHKTLSQGAHSMPHEVHNVQPGSTQTARELTSETDQVSLESVRVVLGCFILSSMYFISLPLCLYPSTSNTVSSYFGQIDAMRWTPRMEEYLSLVSTNTASKMDKFLGLQVRLQRVIQQAVDMRDQQELTRSLAAPLSPSTEPLLASFYLKTLQAQLQQVRSCIPLELQQEEIIIMYLHYAELSIYETVHTVNPDILSTSGSDFIPVGSAPTLGFERLECHWRSLGAIKSWLDVFFTLPPSVCVGFSFPFWAQMVRCLVVLYRLSICLDSARDQPTVRQTVDLLAVLDRIADKIRRTAVEAGEKSPNELFSQIVRIMKRFQAWAAARLEPAPQPKAFSMPDPPIASAEALTTWSYPGTDGEEILINDHQMLTQLLDIGNDTWFDEYFRSP
ncbi:hypothetical protein BGW36DRAFT_405529 [Talaromyces proteolyticus]|uniref:Zn(2)-C6 fungal-type domain-containing protein n=1 Tax=Talaromyces proteolyticus TaxID=1131652 RepID=A0AAD4KUI4_9EURO|nr:uncharacterized protein BGW36DRAFT_405529 [Talaromyces proteolyticus]KAH8700254.1 hypothetical protein BGW36DRAFT_405529 [Talaromyces proteolyticus]